MKLNDVKKLHQKKYRSQLGYYLVEGEHLILELHKAAKSQAAITKVTLYVTADYQDWAKQLESDFEIVTVNSKQMALISDTKTPQGIVALVPLPDFLSKEDKAYLIQWSNPKNIPTDEVFRSWVKALKEYSVDFDGISNYNAAARISELLVNKEKTNKSCFYQDVAIIKAIIDNSKAKVFIFDGTFSMYAYYTKVFALAFDKSKYCKNSLLNLIFILFYFFRMQMYIKF